MPRRAFLWVFVTCAALTAGGCGQDEAKVRLNKADRAVEQFLDAWSRGEPADTFAGAEQPIQGSDPDWKAGYKLASFLSAESKQDPDRTDHIRCRVALSLKDARGRQLDRDVTYDVQVGNTVVINRASP